MARLVRGEFLAMRDREFVQACICDGHERRRIILRHILPNCLSPIIVTGSLMVATAILIESALSFLGLGDPNVMSWGFMIGCRAHVPAHRLVGVRDPGHRDPAHRAVDQPRRRGTQRRAEPSASALVPTRIAARPPRRLPRSPAAQPYR